MRFRRYIQIYLNEQLMDVESFISDTDFGPLFDMTNAATTHHFYVGDFIQRGFNRFNFVGEFPHPEVDNA